MEKRGLQICEKWHSGVWFIPGMEDGGFLQDTICEFKIIMYLPEAG
jgi:hypothetical protein